MIYSRELLKFTGIVLAVAVLVAAAGYFLPYQILKAVALSSGEILGAYTKLARIDLAKESSKTNQETLKTRERDLVRLNQAFTDPESPLPLIERLEALAKSAEVDLSIDLIQVPERKLPDFQLSLSGTTPRLMTFLRLLENAEMAVIVNRASFDKLTPEELIVLRNKSGRAPATERLVLKIRALTLE